MQVAQPALVRNQSAVISNSNKQGCIGGIACVQRRSQLQLLTAQSVTTTTRERTETGAGTEPPSTLFSNVNPRSLKRESGSVASAALLVGGATVGAGILALPAVTQEAGFGASSIMIVLCSMYSVLTGLCIAEVNIRTIAQRGAGYVGLVSMAEATLGPGWAVAVRGLYLFQNYALLVAYVSRGSGALANAGGLEPWVAAVTFSAGLGGLCYTLSPRQVESVNSGLVLGSLLPFVGLLTICSSQVDLAELSRAYWPAVLPTVPVICLAFVYHNIVPVVVNNLEGDAEKVRQAILMGVGGPALMYLAWDGTVLGALSNLLAMAPAAAANGAGSSGGSTDVVAAVGEVLEAMRANVAVGAVAGAASELTSSAALSDLAAASLGSATPPAAMGVTGLAPMAAEAAADTTLSAQAAASESVSSSSPELAAALLPAVSQAELAGQIEALERSASFASTLTSGDVAASAALTLSSSTSTPVKSDPLQLLALTGNDLVSPLVQSFVLTTIASSYICFVLAVSEFLPDAFRPLASAPRSARFALVMLPPFAFATSDPKIFLGALEIAGTYGVMSLYGFIPALMAWSSRYGLPWATGVGGSSSMGTSTVSQGSSVTSSGGVSSRSGQSSSSSSSGSGMTTGGHGVSEGLSTVAANVELVPGGPLMIASIGLAAVAVAVGAIIVPPAHH